MSASPELSPPSYLGSGEVHDRTVRLEPYPKFPWYYDQTKSTAAMALAVLAIIVVGIWISPMLFG